MYQLTVTAKNFFAFHRPNKFKRSTLNLIIIIHLLYKTMLKVNQGSSQHMEQSTFENTIPPKEVKMQI